MDVENLMDDGLGKGVYQLGILIAACLFSFVSTDSFAINFIAGKMDHTCSEASHGDFQHLPDASYSNVIPFLTNGTFILRKCYSELILNVSSATGEFERLACSRWEYDRSTYVSTIVSEYDLVCWRGWLVDLVSTFYMAGRVFACLTHGYFSDQYGRKKVLIGSHILKLVGGVMSLYSPNYPVFALSRFIIAVGSTASCMASFVLLVECAGSKWRHKVGILFTSSPALGGMVLSLVAYLVRDHKHLQAVYTWPQFVLCLSFFILDESPKWLMSQGQNEKALKVMEKMANVNNKMPLLQDSLNKQTSEETISLIKSKKSKTLFIRELICDGMFANKYMTVKTLILWTCWFVTALMYYALSLNTGRLPGSIFLNTFLLNIVEIPANLVTIFVMEKYGGRVTLGCFTAFAGISSFAMIPFMFHEDSEYVVTALGILGKGLITVSYNTLYVETAETYPTRIRSQAMGISASFGRLSSMASSFLGGIMADVWRPLPSLIFGSLAFVSGVLFVCFPKVNTGDMTTHRDGQSSSLSTMNKVISDQKSVA